MKTSPLGVAFIEYHEGVVLRAYLDPVGIWTIGAGLTAASGVVVPKAGMVITREEASRLLAEALRGNYEPTVAVAMTRTFGSAYAAPKPHEFDAGVSFHWNTGAIKKASWVTAWTQNALASAVRAKLLLWNKGGGKVLPGLVRRRSEEADMLLYGNYPSALRNLAPQEVPSPTLGAWALPLSPAEKNAAREGLNSLGYQAGSVSEIVNLAAVKAFQKDSALTVDGIIGRATLSTLQRRLDAKAAIVAPATVLTLAGTGSAGLLSQMTDLPMADGAGLLVAALVGAKSAWSYRDVIATNVSLSLPRIAAFLRSF